MLVVRAFFFAPVLKVLLLVTLCCSTVFAGEYQSLKGELDQEIIDSLVQPVSTGSRFFNLLVIGQDRRAGKGKNTPIQRDVSGREMFPLASRGDSINLVSFDRVEKSITQYIFYRGNVVSKNCEDPYDEDGQRRYLANYYKEKGRQIFFRCIEKMHFYRLRSNFGYDPDVDDPSEVQIHSFVEVNLANFTKGLGEIVSSVGNFGGLSWTYSTHITKIGGFYKLIQYLRKKEDRQSSNQKGPALLRELRERKSYKAGGYQRALNIGQFVITLLGYGAYGLAEDPNLLTYFEEFHQKYLSYSHSLTSLGEHLLDEDQSSMITWAGYKQDQSQVKFVLWGNYWNEYAWGYPGGDSGKVNLKSAALKRVDLSKPSLIPAPHNCKNCPTTRELESAGEVVLIR